MTALCIRAARFVIVTMLWMHAMQLHAELNLVSQVGESSAITRLQPRDIFGLNYAVDPQISPSGEKIAYVNVAMDIMSDSARREIWLVDVDTKQREALWEGQEQQFAPRWSPDGQNIAYFSKNTDGWALYSHSGEFGNHRLSALAGRPLHLAWSADGQQLAFVQFVPNDRDILITMPEKPEGAIWAPPARQIESLVYRVNDVGYLGNGSFQIFAVAAEGGIPRQLTFERSDKITPFSGTKGPLSWSADSTKVFFSSDLANDSGSELLEADIYSVSAISGEVVRHTTRKGLDTSPQISPNGKLLAFLGQRARRTGYNGNDLYVLDLISGKLSQLCSEIDRSIENPQWTSDGKAIWFQYEDAGVFRVGKCDLQAQLTQTPIRLGGGRLSQPYPSGSFSISNDVMLAVTVGSETRPADVAISRDGKTVEMLTSLNEDLLSNKALGSVEKITWQSSRDGLGMEGWVVLPPDFGPDKRYPMILLLHGGPHMAFGPNFSADAQLYAAAGYVVFYPNYRGSSSYGDRFGTANHLNYPGNEYDDIISGVDTVIKKYSVYADQLYITGHSAGGTLAAWIIGNTKRFRAAAIQGPAVNFVSGALTADFGLYVSDYWFNSSVWDNFEEYWRRSPLRLVGSVTTPTILITGELDYRTPISQTEEYYQALKQQKVDAIMVRIPGASHAMSKRPSWIITRTSYVLAWFNRYGAASARD